MSGEPVSFLILVFSIVAGVAGIGILVTITVHAIRERRQRLTPEQALEFAARLLEVRDKYGRSRVATYTRTRRCGCKECRTAHARAMELVATMNGFLGDPHIRASLDAYLEQERSGELGPGIPHEEVGRRLGLLGDDDEARAGKDAP
jgi:hypothetical protein